MSRLAAAAFVALVAAACEKESARGGVVAAPGPAHVGSRACAECHAQQHADWSGSHHALAMQPATAATVLGDFSGVESRHAGTVAKFFRRGEAFFVQVEGADGAMADHEVRWTFGVAPLQQYLVALDRGRLQALDVAWDARDAALGGQRWIWLHPDERIRPGDPLHWTGPAFEWNHMCAECHSTNVQKGFDAATRNYVTTASEHGVGCEGCHGPGEAHVAWAKRGDAARANDANKGLAHLLHKPGVFAFSDGAVTASRVDAKDRSEQESCARCHSRRTTTREDYEFGRPLLDTHLPALLDDPLYFADGQIRDEVFEHGSFLQSRMHAAGVTCGDCHEAHSGKLLAEGNALCARCHMPSHYDQPSHHHHAAGTKGASCVECHMPERVYMVVDPRRDHSIRVPRPDLALRHGGPDACTQCHQGKSAKWAADEIAGWRGKDAPPLRDHWAAAIAAGHSGAPQSERLLVEAMRRSEWPSIVRATAARLSASSRGDAADRELRTLLRDPDPLVRYGAVLGMEGREPMARVAALSPMLTDPIANVRTQAAFALADCESLLGAADQRAFLSAAADYESAQRSNAERDFAWVNLGLFAARRGRIEEAQSHCRRALLADPGSVRAAVNLADLLRESGRDADGEVILRTALSHAWEKAPLQHALGLLLVRAGRREEAMAMLAEAARASTASARHLYVFAVALAGEGRTEDAVLQLEAAQRRDPWNRDVLEALATFTATARGAVHAIPWAQKLVELDPQDEALRAQLVELQSAK